MKRYAWGIIMLCLCGALTYSLCTGAPTPANTVIINGGDAGVVGVDDMPGDTIVSFTYSGMFFSGYKSNSVSVTVSTGYAVGFTPPAGNANVLQGNTTYYPFTVVNHANVDDTITIAAQVTGGQPWPVQVLRDTNADGIHQAGETTAATGTGVLPPEGSFSFFLGVPVPSTATVGQFCAVRLTFKNQNGAGTEDNWSTVGNDTIVYTATTTCIQDATPPEIIAATTNPRGIIGAIGEKFLIRATVADPESGLVSVSLRYSINNSTFTVAMSFADGRYSCDLGPVITGDGTVKYSIIAVNGAGMQAVTAETTVTISHTVVHPPASEGTVGLPDGNPDDGQTQVSIPPGALDHPIGVSIEQKNRQDYIATGSALGWHPSAVYSFGPDGTVFNKAVTLTLLYLDLNNDGRDDATGYNADTLRVFWWDGFEWRYLGGTVDRNSRTVSVPVMHFSLYALFPAQEPSADDYRPKENIITPNGDGINDMATFGIPAGVTIKVFDTVGRVIRTLDGITVWDGKDDGATIVESGVYIYQFRVNGKLISGVIVVAK